MATPVYDYDNNTIGVLGAHLYWEWTREVERSVLEDKIDTDTAFKDEEVGMWILTSDRKVQLGSIGTEYFNASEPLPIDIPNVNYAIDTFRTFATQHWPKTNTEYLVGSKLRRLVFTNSLSRAMQRISNVPISRMGSRSDNKWESVIRKQRSTNHHFLVFFFLYPRTFNEIHT